MVSQLSDTMGIIRADLVGLGERINGLSKDGSLPGVSASELLLIIDSTLGVIDGYESAQPKIYGKRAWLAGEHFLGEPSV